MENNNLFGKKLIIQYYAMDGEKLKKEKNFGSYKIHGGLNGVKMEILSNLILKKNLFQ